MEKNRYPGAIIVGGIGIILGMIGIYFSLKRLGVIP